MKRRFKQKYYKHCVECIYESSNGCIFHKTCSILNCKTYKPYRHGIIQDRQYKKLHDSFRYLI
jgi:hypothetical protein